VPVIQGLRSRAENLSAHEIERAKKLLAARRVAGGS
jgi:hypothetical protein